MEHLYKKTFCVIKTSYRILENTILGSGVGLAVKQILDDFSELLASYHVDEWMGRSLLGLSILVALKKLLINDKNNKKSKE